MVTNKIVVESKTGLHARPATLLVKKASSFKSEIYIEYNGKRANVKSLIGVLSLGVVKGANIEVITEGIDEAEANEAIIELIKGLEN